MNSEWSTYGVHNLKQEPRPPTFLFLEMPFLFPEADTVNLNEAVGAADATRSSHNVPARQLTCLMRKDWPRIDDLHRVKVIQTVYLVGSSRFLLLSEVGLRYSALNGLKLDSTSASPSVCFARRSACCCSHRTGGANSERIRSLHFFRALNTRQPNGVTAHA